MAHLKKIVKTRNQQSMKNQKWKLNWIIRFQNFSNTGLSRSLFHAMLFFLLSFDCFKDLFPFFLEKGRERDVPKRGRGSARGEGGIEREERGFHLAPKMYYIGWNDIRPSLSIFSSGKNYYACNKKGSWPMKSFEGPEIEIFYDHVSVGSYPPCFID